MFWSASVSVSNDEEMRDSDENGLNGQESRSHNKKLAKKIQLAHHDLERNKLMLGRSNNKLRSDIDHIESQQVSNLYAIKMNQHVLKQELDFVKNSSGYYD